MNYIANKQITTRSSTNDEAAQRYERGDMIPAETYDEKTVAAWLKRGIIRAEGEPEPEPVELGAAAQHEDEDIVPNKSRQAGKNKKG